LLEPVSQLIFGVGQSLARIGLYATDKYFFIIDSNVQYMCIY